MNKTKMTVTLGFGKANFPNTTASYLCQKVEPPFVRVSAINSGKTGFNSGQTYLPGGIVNRGEIWVRPVEHDEGTIICLKAAWQRAGVPIRDGVVFVRLRETAAEWEIHYKVPTDRENVIGDSIGAFIGRGDVLSLEDVTALGIEVPSYWQNNLMAEEEVDECFRFTQISKGTPRPELVVRGEGREAEIVEVARVPQRRMNFRRRG